MYKCLMDEVVSASIMEYNEQLDNNSELSDFQIRMLKWYLLQSDKLAEDIVLSCRALLKKNDYLISHKSVDFSLSLNDYLGL